MSVSPIPIFGSGDYPNSVREMTSATARRVVYLRLCVTPVFRRKRRNNEQTNEGDDDADLLSSTSSTNAAAAAETATLERSPHCTQTDVPTPQPSAASPSRLRFRPLKTARHLCPLVPSVLCGLRSVFTSIICARIVCKRGKITKQFEVRRRERTDGQMTPIRQEESFFGRCTLRMVLRAASECQVSPLRCYCEMNSLEGQTPARPVAVANRRFAVRPLSSFAFRRASSVRRFRPDNPDMASKLQVVRGARVEG